MLAKKHFVYGQAKDGQIDLGNALEIPVLRVFAYDGIGFIAMIDNAVYEFLGKTVIVPGLLLVFKKELQIPRKVIGRINVPKVYELDGGDPVVASGTHDEFSGLLESGKIERTDVLSGEESETAHLPRLRLHFNRKAVGRLRTLIDQLNAFAKEPAPPRGARRREIFPTPMPEEQVEAEYEEDE